MLLYQSLILSKFGKMVLLLFMRLLGLRNGSRAPSEAFKAREAKEMPVPTAVQRDISWKECIISALANRIDRMQAIRSQTSLRDLWYKDKGTIFTHPCCCGILQSRPPEDDQDKSTNNQPVYPIKRTHCLLSALFLTASSTTSFHYKYSSFFRSCLIVGATLRC